MLPLASAAPIPPTQCVRVSLSRRTTRYVTATASARNAISTSGRKETRTLPGSDLALDTAEPAPGRVMAAIAAALGR
jgi:hypothetical protein